MPRSMSAAEPTPSPSAKHASLTSWATIRPPTSPGPSPTHSARRPSVAKNASAAAATAGAVAGPRVSSTSPPSSTGSGQREAGRAPARILGGERRGVAEQHLRAALQRRVVLAGAAVHDQRRHLAVGLPGRPRVPARGLRGGEQVVGDLVLARDDDEAPGAAARLGRGRVGRPARRVGVPALAGLAPVAPARGELRGERRRAASAARASGRGRTRRSPRRRRRRPGPSARRGPSGSRRRGGRCGRPARAWRAPPARSAAPRARTAGCSG